MWNEISKLIDPNFKPAATWSKKRLKGKEKKEKATIKLIKKENLEKTVKIFLVKGKSDRPSREDGEKKSFGEKFWKNQNLLVREDQIDHQEMERKKVLVIKGKSSFRKKR
jgi:hypothetical protein